MLRQGPIPLFGHGIAEYLIGELVFAAAFLFGFSDLGAPTAVSIVVGIGVIFLGATTSWSTSLVNQVPLNVHILLDYLLGAVLIASPFLFGFSDETAPTVFFLVM